MLARLFSRNLRRLAALTLLLLLPVAAYAEPLPTSVEIARAPDRPWSVEKTRTLAALPNLPSDPPPSRFGGAPDITTPDATGFFRTQKSDGRWWLIDPDGHPFIHRGVTSVRLLPSRGAKERLREQFKTTRQWADASGEQLHAHHFNGLGAWCDDRTLRPADNKLVYTKIWNFMSIYGRKRGGTTQESGHRGYPGDCPFIFDPGFPEFCIEHARKLAATKDDPWLLGHFTD
ncbi:hypothetical protein OAF27_02235, partial [Verrucomicrobiales bacterium]|nr:hypothetical protein [Verrucomicrobiales bacterium]